MEDLIAAAATIQGAQIQARYTLWAALLSAVVGALGIVFGALCAWRNGVKLHQHNNIIEAKREVYLDVISRYQCLINDLQLINVLPNQFFEILLNNKRDFFISIGKVKLICEHKNKDMVEAFALKIAGEMDYLMPFINDFIDKRNELDVSFKSRQEFFLKNEVDVGNLNPNVFEKLKIKDFVFRDIKAEFMDKKIKLESAIQEFKNNMNVDGEKFSNALRCELKITDDLI